jgi:ketosteroid isomerase-like protein
VNDFAYDYGYYSGSSAKTGEESSKFQGKYVIIWKKENNDWKIYLDIWNRIDPLNK